jgi:hypothetical protein
VTKPKYPPHRLGLHSRNAPDRTSEDIVEHAQDLWLRYVARLAPDVLRSLKGVPGRFRHLGIDEAHDEPDPGALTVWAGEWHLTDAWCLAYARSTWCAWRRYPQLRRDVWCPRDDIKGRLFKPRPGRQALRPLKAPEHFEWLVRYQVLGQPYKAISSDARNACIRLAKLLNLRLRPAERGWMRRNRARQASRPQ